MAANYFIVTYFAWDHSRYSSYTNGKLIFYFKDYYDGYTTNVRIYDSESDKVLAENGYSGNGCYSLDFNNPTNDTLLEIHVKVVPSAPLAIEIFSAQLEFDN